MFDRFQTAGTKYPIHPRSSGFYELWRNGNSTINRVNVNKTFLKPDRCRCQAIKNIALLLTQKYATIEKIQIEPGQKYQCALTQSGFGTYSKILSFLSQLVTDIAEIIKNSSSCSLITSYHI